MRCYDWLHENLFVFFKACGLPGPEEGFYSGIIASQGDKVCCDLEVYKDLGIHPYHVTAIHMLAVATYRSELYRQEDGSFVHMEDWVAKNYKRFEKHLPLVYETPKVAK